VQAEGEKMRLLVGVVLSMIVLVAPASAYAAARHVTAEADFVMFNPCTNEQVRVTGTNHYLVFGPGDLTHTSNGSGIGLTSGNEYVYVRQGFETTVHGTSEVIRLISVGSASDMTLSDELFDPEIGPTITCS
jgi:hypothetical protein